MPIQTLRHVGPDSALGKSPDSGAWFSSAGTGTSERSETPRDFFSILLGWLAAS